MVPVNVAKAQCITPCAQNGVLVYAIPCAPPLLPILLIAALTNVFGVGTNKLAFLIFDMALVTR